MMKYQPVNSLFIPKSNDSGDLNNSTLEETNKSLSKEKEDFLNKIKSYEKLIVELKKEIEIKDDVIFNLTDSISALENEVSTIQTKAEDEKLREIEDLSSEDLNSNDLVSNSDFNLDSDFGLDSNSDSDLNSDSKSDLDLNTNSKDQADFVDSQSKNEKIPQDDYTQLLYILLVLLTIL